jgi:nitroreductase
MESAWQIRYGRDGEVPAGVAPFLEHRSVRRYSEQEVPESLISALIGAAQSASTSSNLQLWSVISVQEPGRRAAIARLCADQGHVHRAPWFLCFFADHARLRAAAAVHGEACAGLDFAEFAIMALIDVALAAERLVCAAEAVGLGACYIGALRNDPAAVQALLGLPQGTFGVFGLTLGYPDPERPASLKPRLPQDAVWHREVYAPNGIGDYDARMDAFFGREGMAQGEPWSAKSGKRVGEDHLAGREVILDYLHRQGMLRR